MLQKVIFFTTKFFQHLQFHCEYILLRIMLIFVENLPVPAAYAFGEVLGTLMFMLASGRRKEIYRNLEIVYPNGFPYNKSIFARRVFANFFHTFIEFVIAQRLLNEKTWRNYVSGPGIEFFMSERNYLHGAVLVTGHIGSFEVLGHVNMYMGYPATTLIQGLRNPLMNQYLCRLMARSGQELIIKQFDAYDKLRNCLAQGGFPTMAVDQHSGSKGLWVDFLGHKAYTVAGPSALVCGYNVPLYVGALFRVGKFRFHLHVEKVELPEFTENKQQNLENVALAMNEVLGRYIQMYPEQWFWMHRRWR